MAHFYIAQHYPHLWSRVCILSVERLFMSFLCLPYLTKHIRAMEKKIRISNYPTNQQIDVNRLN